MFSKHRWQLTKLPIDTWWKQRKQWFPWNIEYRTWAVFKIRNWCKINQFLLLIFEKIFPKKNRIKDRFWSKHLIYVWLIELIWNISLWQFGSKKKEFLQNPKIKQPLQTSSMLYIQVEWILTKYSFISLNLFGLQKRGGENKSENHRGQFCYKFLFPSK